MTPPANTNTREADAASDMDWHWGFEPEAWMSLRSPGAIAGRRPTGASADPVAPARRLLPRLAAAARALFRG